MEGICWYLEAWWFEYDKLLHLPPKLFGQCIHFLGPVELYIVYKRFYFFDDEIFPIAFGIRTGAHAKIYKLTLRWIDAGKVLIKILDWKINFGEKLTYSENGWLFICCKYFVVETVGDINALIAPFILEAFKLPKKSDRIYIFFWSNNSRSVISIFHIYLIIL